MGGLALITYSKRIAAMLREASIGRALRPVMQTDDNLLNSAEALAHLEEGYGVKRAPITFAKWAAEGTGPPFVKLNKFRYYKKSDLDEWVQSHLGRSVQSPTGDVTPLTPLPKTLSCGRMPTPQSAPKAIPR